jgi:glutamyl-tRNA(Gln) amidotransferase subunit E
MRAPWEVAEVAEILRELARATGKVRTGIGRARQDVNVSVEGGTRVEIKGVHRIPCIPRLTHFEALRQANLLELRSELQRRGIRSGTFESTSAEVTLLLAHAGFPPLRRAAERGWRVMAVGLAGFRGLLPFPLQPGRDFAAEISDRVRVIACLDELPNIIHNEMKENPLTPAEWQRMASALALRTDDAIVLVWGGQKDAETAVGEIIIRAREAAAGIPNETRQAFPSGINGFERILPGADRMYPDTDMPPVPLSEERIESAKGRLPLPPWERRKLYRGLGLSLEIAENLLTDRRAPLFQRIVETLSVRPTLPAVILSQTLKSLKRKGFATERLSDESLYDLFGRFSRGEFAREFFPQVLQAMSADGREAGEIILGLGMFRLRDADVREIVRQVARSNQGLEPREPGKKFRFLMGLVMSELRGRMPGEKIAGMLREALETTRPERRE